MQHERVRCIVCSTKNKETKQNSRVKNVTTHGCVLHRKAEHTNVSKYYHCNHRTDIFRQNFLDEIMVIKGVWILQKELYEGTESCQKSLFVQVLTSLQQYEEKIRNTAWRCL